MTKEDIKTALKCCSNPSISYCKDCPYANCGKFDCCNGKMCKDALNLITEQEKEIERLKAENDTNMQYIRMMGIQSHIKTSNEQVKQAQIDILNKAKKKYGFYSCYSWKCDTKSLTEIIDEFIKEVENE